jgi:Berberine and berberine like
MLRWAGGKTSPRAAFHAKSDYVDRPLPSRAQATMIDWIERRQPHPFARFRRAAARRLRRRHQPRPGRGHRVRPPRPAHIDADLDSWRRAYHGRNLARLREVKKAYDPDFRFRFRQAIPPAR